MEDITIQEVAEAIRDMDIRPFITEVRRYMKISAAVDQSLPGHAEKKTGHLHPKKLEQYHACCKDIVREAADILSRSALTASRIINFPFQLNGQAGDIPETDQKTRYYFRELKKQQMELLCVIGDETEIIRNMIRQAEKMRTVMQKHAPTIRQASDMMTLMRERISQRPTTLLRLEGTGKKIRELNKTLETMSDYEHDHEDRMHQEAQTHPVRNAFSSYHDLTRLSGTEILQRKQYLQDCAKELRQSGNLMLKLVTRGYRPFMKKKLDILIDRHTSRHHRFQVLIRQYRETDFKEPEDIPIYSHISTPYCSSPSPSAGIGL